MITSKSVVALIYSLLVLAAVVLPYVIMRTNQTRTQKLRAGVVFAATELALICILYFGSTPRLALSLVLTLPFAILLTPERGPRLWGSILGFVLFSTCIWWAPSTEQVLWRLAPFWVLGGLAIFALRRMQMPMTTGVGRWMLGVTLVLALAAHILTAPIIHGGPFTALWHNWSVYVMPAQLMVAGAVPYHDFPIQYGFGPMVTMALACGADCWAGAYYVVSLANIIYVVMVTLGAGLMMARAPRGLALLSMAAVAISVLLWTCNPQNILGPHGSPSTGGMRFMPIAVLLTWVIYRETRGHASRVWGHVLWAFSLLWSPEAAIFATMVWWPYLALIHVQGQTPRSVAVILRAAALWVGVMIAATCALGLVFSMLFWAGFGQLPDLHGYVIYLLNPPGPLPVNLGGAVWILLGTLALAGLAMFRADDRDTRILTVCILATLGVTTYYLGRSHDNNILNLFPFITLTLISALRLNLTPAASGFAKAMLLGVLVWPSLFGYGILRQVFEHPGEIGFAKVVAATRLAPETLDRLDQIYSHPTPSMSEIADAVHTITALNQGTPILINDFLIFLGAKARQDWTTMADPASYLVLPAEDVRQFIARGKDRFGKSGWLIIQNGQEKLWLDLFGTSYTTAQTRQFPGFTAYLMAPK